MTKQELIDEKEWLELKIEAMENCGDSAESVIEALEELKALNVQIEAAS